MEEQVDRTWHERTNLCPHSDAERTVCGTWCTEEGSGDRLQDYENP